VSNPVYVGRFRAKNGSRPGDHEALVDDTTYQRCAERVRSRRTAALSAPRTRQLWSILQGKVRCARCGQLMNIHVNRYRNRQYVSFRCRRAAAGERACTGTQIRAYDVVRGVGASLRKFPWRRGRPPKWLKATRTPRRQLRLDAGASGSTPDLHGGPAGLPGVNHVPGMRKRQHPDRAQRLPATLSPHFSREAGAASARSYESLKCLFGQTNPRTPPRPAPAPLTAAAARTIGLATSVTLNLNSRMRQVAGIEGTSVHP